MSQTDIIEREQEVVYKDTGCKESKSCLNCPLPVCVEDQPFGWSANKARNDAERVNAVVEAEKTMPRFEAIKKVAKDFGVTDRTVLRVLART